MLKPECAGCRYWGALDGYNGYGIKCCNYAWVTGKCRTTLPKRADGLCPGFASGKRAKADPRRHDKDIHRRHAGGSRPKYDRAQLRRLYELGLSDGQIGAEVGAPARSVCAWRQRSHLPPNVTAAKKDPSSVGQGPTASPQGEASTRKGGEQDGEFCAVSVVRAAGDLGGQPHRADPGGE